jgi:tungstate transport system substrate-binding protein
MWAPFDTKLILASTTSTQDSGLLDVLIPAFEEATGYEVTLVSGGSGQALENGRRGDVDVLLTHSPDAEQEFVDEGYGIERAPVMHNDFVLVGPRDDPASAGDAGAIDDALRAIAVSESRFISRGDDSGTHVAELRLWSGAGIEPAGNGWYEESGQGQGATLQIASQKGAYALTDRGTFIALRDQLELEIVAEGDERLANYYHVIVVNPMKHADVNVEGARAWAAFVTGAEGQEIIRTFGVEEYGEALFVPDGSAVSSGIRAS